MEQVSRSNALRAHDVHLGLQAAEIDRSSGLVGEELEATQLVGMAAALATAIKGIDFIPDATELKRVASQQYDIPTLAFERVVDLLAEVEFVRRIQRTGSRSVTFYENVPEDFARLYRTLDEAYEHLDPSTIDQSVLAAVESLSLGPRPIDSLSIEPALIEKVIHLADAADAVKVIRVEGEEIAYSPYFAYENPEKMGSLLSKVDVQEVQQSYETVRKYQGAPVLDDDNGRVLEGLIGAGLMAGPHLIDPVGNMKIFALAPYGLPEQLLRPEKSVLDKAMAIVAAMRMGQHWGGATPIRSPTAILNRLLEPNRWVARHSSTERQYSVLYQLGIVRFDNFARKAIQLIDTADNKRAVGIARDLLQHGEAMESREQAAGNLLISDPDGNYRTSVQTIRPARHRTAAPKRVIADVIALAMGWKPSV